MLGIILTPIILMIGGTLILTLIINYLRKDVQETPKTVIEESITNQKNIINNKVSKKNSKNLEITDLEKNESFKQTLEIYKNYGFSIVKTTFNSVFMEKPRNSKKARVFLYIFLTFIVLIAVSLYKISIFGALIILPLFFYSNKYKANITITSSGKVEVFGDSIEKIEKNNKIRVKICKITLIVSLCIFLICLIAVVILNYIYKK